MNKNLTDAIIRHILTQLGVVRNSDLDLRKSKSLRDKEFMLPEKLAFQDEDGKTFKGDVWGCQLSMGQQEIKILLGSCSQEVSEYCLMVQLKDAPAYGLYLVDDEVSEPLIGVSIDNTKWLTCNTFLQATFLAGMEQVRETYLIWNKCSEYKSLHDLMLSFIKYHNLTYGNEA